MSRKRKEKATQQQEEYGILDNIRMAVIANSVFLTPEFAGLESEAKSKSKSELERERESELRKSL